MCGVARKLSCAHTLAANLLTFRQLCPNQRKGNRAFWHCEVIRSAVPSSCPVLRCR